MDDCYKFLYRNVRGGEFLLCLLNLLGANCLNGGESRLGDVERWEGVLLSFFG